MSRANLFAPPALPGTDTEINGAVASEIFRVPPESINFLSGPGISLIVERMRKLGWLYGVRTSFHEEGAAIFFFRGEERHYGPGNEYRSVAEAALRAIRSER